MKQGTFTFLGTGGSTGIPMVGCRCPVCTSTDSKDKRMRSSGFFSFGSNRVLIDVGPEFRLQAIQADLTDVTAVFLTHAHADHIAGLDDLRPFYFKSQSKVRCFRSEETLN